MEKNADSNSSSLKSIQPIDLVAFKKDGKKIVCLTAYDYRTAQILDEAGADLILVGDSLANVVLGLDDTYQIGMPEMLYHTRAVARAANRALLVTDLPFLSYQVSVEQSLLNAAEIMKAGAKAVKLEGAAPLTLKVVERMTEVGIPVIGHLGYTPQSASVIGKGRVQGKTSISAQDIFEQARSLEEAGAFAIVLEMIPSELSAKITQSLKIPTIGIGAGIDCDGQILVINDLIGLTSLDFRFVKKYANFADEMKQAVQAFADDVRSKTFPQDKNSFFYKGDGPL